MKTSLPILALISASIIWGAAAPIFKWSITNIPIFPLIFVRFFIASIILIPFLKKTEIETKDFFKIVLLGFFGITINSGLFFLGISLTNAINAGILAATGPIFTIVGALIFLKEKIKPNVALGALIGLLGVLTIILQSFINGAGFSLDLLGNLFLIGSIWGIVGHEVMVKKLQDKYDSVLLTYAMFLVGALSVLPFAYAQLSSRPEFLLYLDVRGYTGIIFGILASSLLAYFFWNWGLSKMPASKVGLFLYADPIAAAVIAVPLLGEKITLLDVLGTILIFTGIYLAERRIHYHRLKAPNSKS